MTSASGLWATRDGQRVFRLPEQALPRGELELLSVGGERQHVDEAAAARFEISREEALRELPGAIRSAVAQRRSGQSNRARQAAVSTEEVQERLARLRSAAASPAMHRALERLAEGVKATGEGARRKQDEPQWSRAPTEDPE